MNSPQTLSAGTAARPTKNNRNRKTVDILHDMQAADPRLRRDAAILQILRDAVRRDLLTYHRQSGPKLNSTLYWKYEGPEFPIHKVGGKRLPRWKSLTSWMKVQLCLLSLGEHGFRPFKYQRHDDLRDELESKGADQREYMRDRLKRQLRAVFGNNTPMFFFVVEDLNDRGIPVRPHAHGAIELKPFPVDEIPDPKALRHLKRIERKKGKEIAEREAGRWIIRAAMRSAAGLVSGPRIASNGVDQSRNVWWRKPTLPIFNDSWVTYCLKNAGEFSPVLSENRLARDYKMLAQAKKLWDIIRGT
ncbi:MAG: hypothetical protein R3E09_08715 [Novosphingobium sp.]